MAEPETTPPAAAPIKPNRTQSWLLAGRYALLALIPAFVVLYMKYELLVSGGYRVCARSLSRIENPEPPPADGFTWSAAVAALHRAAHLPAHDDSQAFTWRERLSFFRGDLLLGFVLLPPVAVLFAWLLPRRARGVMCALASLAAVGWLLAEKRTYALLGRFLSRELLLDALRFGTSTSGPVGDYLDLGAGFVIKGLTLVGAVALLAWWAARGDRRGHVPGRPSRLLAGGLYLGVVGVTACAWLPALPATFFHRSVVAAMATAFAEEDRTSPGEFAPLAQPDLVTRYRTLTGAPAPRLEPAYWGKARDFDVILFVLETAPAKCLPADDLNGFPTLARLSRHAWIARQHQTTYPFTSRAVFSILTSWYPSSERIGYPTRFPTREFPGLMQSLKRRGYATAAYAPDAFTRTYDDSMYARVGIAKRFYSDGSVPGGAGGSVVARRIERDRIALRAFQDDMARGHRSNQRFAAVLLPQIGHGPWVDVTGRGLPATDAIARGRALIAFQDDWLGEIVRQLEQAGRLDRTLILVTGDHGVRTQAEDPVFQGGMIDEYSFHVPLLLYAPGVIPGRRDIPWITSHIDIGPSVLDLLGVSEGRQLEQGAPLWDERLAGRTTFFWAKHYLGAEGYYQPGSRSYQMWNHTTDTVYVSDGMDFRHAAVYGPDAEEYARVREHVQQMARLQEAWVVSGDGGE
jgi:hypothetical protein